MQSGRGLGTKRGAKQENRHSRQQGGHRRPPAGPPVRRRPPITGVGGWDNPSDTAARVARSWQAFTATSTQNHGHLGTSHGHQIFRYGHFHGHNCGQSTLKSRKYFLSSHILSSIKLKIKVGYCYAYILQKKNYKYIIFNCTYTL